MSGTFRAIPLLLSLCDGIDRLFVEEVGPFGQMITGEARADWLASGNKMKPSDVDEYIARLAREIDDRERRSAFIAQAKEIVGIR